jgi:hypothetical protein
MPSNTASYSFQKPSVGGDSDAWGGYLNDNWDLVDDLLDGTEAVDGIDIDGGSIDGTPVGANSRSTGAFTTLAVNGAATFTSTMSVTGNVTLADVSVSGTATVADIDVSGSATFADVTLSDTLTLNGLVNVANADPIVQLEDSDASGTVRLRQTGSIGWVDIDPTSADASSSWQVWIDGVNVLTTDSLGHTRFGDGTDPTVTAEFAGTDAILLPVGTTAQEPADVAGHLRYNSDLGAPTFSNGTEHKVLSSGWELWETAYDFSVDGAQATATANGWEDGWEYLVMGRQISFSSTANIQIAGEFSGTTNTAFTNIGASVVVAAGDYSFEVTVRLPRLSRNVFFVESSAFRNDNGTFTDTIGSATGAIDYIGITRASAEKMSGIVIQGSTGNIDGGVITVYRRRVNV